LKFICSPEESEKDLGRPLKLTNTLAFAGNITKVSSTYTELKGNLHQNFH